MFIHQTPEDMSKYLKATDVRDNLVSAEPDKPLSANQGRILKGLIDGKDNVVSGTVAGNNLQLTTSKGNNIDIDVTALVLDTKAISGHYDVATQSLVIVLNDATQFSIPVASLLPVLTDNTITGDGSGVPLSVSINTDADNTLILDVNRKLKVPAEVPSGIAGNILKRNPDGKLAVMMRDEDDMVSDDADAPASQQSTKAYVDRERVFLNTDTFTPADPDKPTIAEVAAAVGDKERVIIYYTKTNKGSDKPTHTWHIDSAGNVTPLGSEKEEGKGQADFIKNADLTAVDHKAPTPAEILAYCDDQNPKLRDIILYFNQTDDKTIKPTHTWYVDSEGEVVPLGGETEEGLRGKPVADIAALKALIARDDEHRQVGRSNYIFSLTPKLTPEEIADPLNESDNADTGKWVLQKISASSKLTLIDKTIHQNGGMIYVGTDEVLVTIIDNNLKFKAGRRYIIYANTSVYEPADLTRDYKLVLGDGSLDTPKWKEFVQRSTDGSGYSNVLTPWTPVMTYDSKADETLTLYITCKQNTNTGHWLQPKEELRYIVRELPESIVEKVDPNLVPVETVPDDEIKNVNIRASSGEVIIDFAEIPDTILVFGKGYSSYEEGNIIPLSDLKASGTLLKTVSGRNDIDAGEANAGEVFIIAYKARYISDTRIGINVIRSGYVEKDKNFTVTAYPIHKVIGRHKAKKTIMKLDPNVTIAKTVTAIFVGMTADGGETSKKIYEGTTSYISVVDLSPNKMLDEALCTNCTVVDASKGIIAFQREIDGGNFNVGLGEKDKLVNSYNFKMIANNVSDYSTKTFSFVYTPGMKHILQVSCSVHRGAAGEAQMKAYLQSDAMALTLVHTWDHHIESGHHAIRAERFEIPDNLAAGTYEFSIGTNVGTWVYTDNTISVTVEKY